MVPISVLDLVPVIVDETPREALPKSLDLAQHAERFGYKRIWVAELGVNVVAADTDEDARRPTA